MCTLAVACLLTTPPSPVTITAVHARLHNGSVQAATVSAGGLALALAVLSLVHEERARHAPPLVSARSAGLLARLSTLPEALAVMVRPGVIDRIIEVRSRVPMNHPVVLPLTAGVRPPRYRIFFLVFMFWR